jgi:hypothetical protein
LSRKRLLLAAGLALGLLALGVGWQWWASGPDPGPAQAEAGDPRLTFATPYRNVRPEVNYVGDRACVSCHPDQAAAYRRHPMSRALVPGADAEPVEQYGPAASNPFVAADPFVTSGLHYRVQPRAGRPIHREWAADADGKVLAEMEAEASFAVGSGKRGRAYLVSRDGYLFQSPITWYPQGGRWDLSPGYAVRNQHFGRPITPGCLFCHSNHADHVPDTVNRYRPPIFKGYGVGCERCHGPGELHVKRRAAGATVAGLDDTIVNPARLAPPLREAVCQQCHLQGEQRVVARGRSDFDYRPGLPLHLFLMDFVVEGEGRDNKFVGTVEQMVASRCYQASRGPKQLGCISCHDPHRQPPPEEKVAHYRKRCLQCHAETSCTVPPAARRARSKEDSCVACHMPRTGSEINHTSITDHRVPRRAAEPGTGAATPPTFPGPAALVPFHRDLLDPQDEEAARNRGVALMGLLARQPPEAAARQLAEEALPLLEAALRKDGHDGPAREAKGAALACLGHQDEALAAYEAVLADRPERETTLQAAASVALQMKRLDAGRTYLERAVRVNPWRWQSYHLLAAASFQIGQWERAARECGQSIQLEPFYATTRRRLLVECYLHLGRPDEARAAFDTLLRLSREERRPELQRWFQGLRR